MGGRGGAYAPSSKLGGGKLEFDEVSCWSGLVGEGNSLTRCQRSWMRTWRWSKDRDAVVVARETQAMGEREREAWACHSWHVGLVERFPWKNYFRSWPCWFSGLISNGTCQYQVSGGITLRAVKTLMSYQISEHLSKDGLYLSHFW